MSGRGYLILWVVQSGPGGAITGPGAIITPDRFGKEGRWNRRIISTLNRSLFNLIASNLMMQNRKGEVVAEIRTVA